MKKSILFFCVASLLGAIGNASADLVQNGSFELPAPGAGVGSTTYFSSGAFPLTGWNFAPSPGVAIATIDYVGPVPPPDPSNPSPPTSGWTAAQGTSSIDMNGLPGFGAGILSQTFDTVAGTLYEVIFAMAGNPYGGDRFKDLSVSAPGISEDFTFDTKDKTPTDMGWTDNPLTFLATGALSTLTFASLENNAFGPAIDNVRVNVAASVPEPATLLLLGAGLTGLALFGRRKFVN